MQGDDEPAPDFAALANAGLDLDTIFEVLSERRRRSLVAVLQEHARPIALADAADEIAVREHEAPITEIPPEDVTSIYADLYHVHLPKLEEAGIVEYDQERDLVALADRAETLSHLLSR